MEVSSVWVVFATLLASACVCQGQGCSANTECDNLGGSCVATGSCSGISYDACGSGCTCCIPDNGTCAALQYCADLAGVCIHLDDSSKCPGVLYPYYCLGTDCTCCLYSCPTTYDCTAAGGYCFRTDGPYVCEGDVLDLCYFGVCKCCVNPQCPPHGHGQGNGQGQGNGKAKSQGIGHAYGYGRGFGQEVETFAQASASGNKRDRRAAWARVFGSLTGGSPVQALAPADDAVGSPAQGPWQQ